MHEFDIIRRYFLPIARASQGALLLQDDAALIPPEPGKTGVVTQDMIVENVHFFSEDSPFEIAQKLLRVNISDLAAMGATPRGYMLSFLLSKEVSETWIAQFAEGLSKDIAHFGGELWGGDTATHAGPNVFSLTAFGVVDEGKALKRSGAKQGDSIFVSGTIGDSLLGLRCLSPSSRKLTLTAEEEAYCTGRYHIPEPRLALGIGLAGIAHAAVDISDGLVADAGHICTASRLRAKIFAGRIPLSLVGKQRVQAGEITREALITGGDDYELLFTAPPASRPKIAALAKQCGVAVTEIGVMEAGEGIGVYDDAGKELVLEEKGYRHQVRI